MKISQVVPKVIAKTMRIKNPAEISLDDLLEEDLGMDDIDVDTVVEELSEIYDVDLGAFYDYNRHKSVRSLCALVQKYRE